MNYHFWLPLLIVLYVLHTIDGAITPTISPNSEAEIGTTNTYNDADLGIKVSKLDSEEIYPIPIICYNKTEISLKTLEELKEYCEYNHGTVKKGRFPFEVAFLEPIVVPNSDEVLDLFASQTEANDSTDKEKKNSRKKRFKREDMYATDVQNPSGIFECFGCISSENVVIFTNVVKIGNETEDCEDGSIDCQSRHKPYVAFDIVLGAFVSFLFCVLLLAILSCHPVILDGHYTPLRHIHCMDRSRNLLKVRYRNQAFDDNDFSIVDFE